MGQLRHLNHNYALDVKEGQIEYRNVYVADITFAHILQEYAWGPKA